MTSAGAPMVFVIDDDASLRTFIQVLLTWVGLRSESFRTAQSSRYVTGRPCWWMVESPPAQPAPWLRRVLISQRNRVKSSYHDKRLLSLTWNSAGFLPLVPQGLVPRIFGPLLATACLGCANSSSSGHSSDLFR